MSDQNEVDRVRTLERRVRALWVALALAVALQLFLGFVWHPSRPPATSIGFGDAPQTTLSENGLVVAPMSVFDGEGVHVKVPVRGHDGRDSEAILRATADSAFLSIGQADVGITEGTDQNSDVVSWKANGKVDSTILIDTSTGAWTLVRARRSGGHISKEERTVLLAPLAP